MESSGSSRVQSERGVSLAFASRSVRRGFSLVEVLLAVFILAIGMIMVASVFPVGANWTRQATEDSVGQVVAQTALSVIQTHYGPNGDLRSFLAPDYLNGPSVPNPGNNNFVLKAPIPPATIAAATPYWLQAIPGFVNIPPNERAYQFGSTNPFPATNFKSCTYFWSALIRLNPAYKVTDPTTNNIVMSSSYKYDLYILVFRKGSPEQQFNSLSVFGGLGEVPFTRHIAATPVFPAYNSYLIPSLWYATGSVGKHDPGRTPSVYDAVPPIGQYGIGVASGTVFRQVVDPVALATPPGAGGAMPRPGIVPGEPVIYSPAPDGTSNAASPLIYVYQTTLSF